MTNQYTIEQLEDMNSSELGYALLELAEYSNTPISTFKTILEFGADTNKCNIINASPLHYAVHHDNLELIKLLLEYGAQINCFDHYGFTPWEWSSEYIQENVPYLDPYYREF